MVDYSKLKKGQKFIWKLNTKYTINGKLVNHPKYISNSSRGLYYATVELEDGQIRQGFMICRTDIEWLPIVSDTDTLKGSESV